jgi:hypothetical protein
MVCTSTNSLLNNAHAVVEGVLKLFNRYPFDRMIAAQALVEGLGAERVWWRSPLPRRQHFLAQYLVHPRLVALALRFQPMQRVAVEPAVICCLTGR